MKKLKYCLAVMLAACALAPLQSCSDDDDNNSPKIIPTMQLNVSDINDDRTAVVNSEQTAGTTYGAKVIDFYPVSDLTFDYTIEVKLVKFVEENGVEATLPYRNKITTGLKPGVDYISAIIAYNDKGRAVCSAYQIWTSGGYPGLWSDTNTPGELEDNEWN